jgi:hypothetical protein
VPLCLQGFCLCRHTLPWPCKSTSSMPRLSGCSTWCAAYLDGMCRFLLGGLVLVSLFSATFPPKSLCSLFPNSPAGWLCRSHLSSCSYWRGLASSLYLWRPASYFRRPSSPSSARCPWRRCSFPLLPPAFGGKDDHQPREGGQRDEPRLHPSRPQLIGVGSELCCGSISLALMALVPPPTLSPAAKRAWLSVHRTGDGRAMRRSATSVASPAPPAALLRCRPVGRTRRRTPWRWRPRSWMVLYSPL